MRKHNKSNSIKSIGRRGAAWLLALALMCGLMPGAGLSALAVQAPGTGNQAEYGHWAQEYLDKLVSWGVMRGDIDGNLRPDADISRAEFVTMVNRAYGYDEVGVNPFTDVDFHSWYADDISIAYNVGYFTGTSSTTASPDLGLTREQATLLLGRNMMLEASTGETLGYADSREFSDWSRAMIPAASNAGIINGYSDGTFRPQNNITRGEVAAMLARSLGTPIYEAGEYELGNVYGNVTIATSGVNLRNTVIAGDLYLTGGIGLGELLLENVTVLGRIIASGAGESNKGDSSIILRNVEADSMVVDSINNQFVTLRVEGDTDIDVTSVRTPAYLEDVTPDEYGLKLVQLEGEAGTSLQLAGNVKEVVNLTPNSYLHMAQGSAQRVTIDEKAMGATMQIDLGARVKELNLDVATTVTGTGDVDHVNISAAGCTVAMPPDTVDIRPGISSSVAGEAMDNVTAAEYSADPRILAGYPEARNVAPTGADAVFSTNKRGTVYWAITALADGSVSEDDLITPPVYGGIILQSGTLQAAASKTEYTAKLNKLTADGSYYLSAIMVDSRGQHSPVKVTAFTTPDDTVPAFTTGYPVMSKITGESAQVTVMTNKNCQLYWALLPKGSSAPTGQDFKTNAITGNLGYGSLDAIKNNTVPFTVNNISLEELTTYDLYLWLTDYDGAKSSAVRKMSFTTLDATPPVVRHMDQTNALATSVEMTYALNEPGTIYWAVVKAGEDFLRPLTGQTTTPLLTDPAAKSQVEAGIGALRKGSSSAARADTDIKFTISGLEGQAAYDLYYVAKDKAGNYSASVEKITINTLDNQPPTVTQEFTSYNGGETGTPLADTDIRLVFSESIAGLTVEGGQRTYNSFLEAYEKARKGGEQERNELAQLLSRHITMYQIVNGVKTEVGVRDSNSAADAEWTIDFRYATVTQESGKMVVTFPYNSDSKQSALKLESGATYFFHLQNITDESLAHNVMNPLDLPTFRTVYAQVNLSNSDIGTISVGGESVRLDMSFNMKPVSTKTVPETECWDLLLWSDVSVGLTVYYRVVDSRGNAVAGQDWKQVGQEANITSVGGAFSGISYTDAVKTVSGQAEFSYLKEGLEGGLNENYTYQFGIHFTRIEDLTEYDTWSKMVTMKFGVAAGGSGDLRTLAGNVTGNWERLKEDQSVSSIGLAFSTQGTSDELTIRRQFSDRTAPKFLDNAPVFEIGSSVLKMTLSLDREGTIYYVVAPKNQFAPSVYNPPGDVSGNTIPINTSNDDNVNQISTYIPKDGADRNKIKNDPYAGSKDNVLATPTYLSIVNPRFANSPDVKYGTVDFTYAAQEIEIEGLIPSRKDENGQMIDSEYYIYFVLKGGGEVFSRVECYQFTTKEVEVPIVTVTSQNPNAALSTDTESYLSYAVVEYNKLPTWIRSKFTPDTTDDNYKLPADATVLDAMVTVVPGRGGKSYFDVYANDDLKSKVMRYIRGDTQESTQYEPENRWKDVQLNRTETEQGKFAPYMDPDLEYVVLATARHIYGGEDGEAYGFKAIRALYLPDEIPPDYTGGLLIMPSITSAKDADNNEIKNPNTWQSSDNPGQYTYTGTVTVTFTKELYQVVGNIRNAVWAVNKDDATGENVVSIIEALGGNKAKFSVATGDEIKGPTNSFVLTFTDLRMGESITFFGTGNIGNGSSYTTPKKLTLTFDPYLKNSDYPGFNLDWYQPGFRVTWQ